nr:receptor-like serine/threonine-protein kinase SD1-8 [Tanacetum cinerariifolium]
MSGELKNGNIILVDQSETSIWSSNHSVPAVNTVAQLLNNGNFVLRRENDENPENYIWQSFDYPTDTLLPEMKLGRNRKTGNTLFLMSWKNNTDPGFGDYSYKLDIEGIPELLIWKNDIKTHRSGPWTGKVFGGTPELTGISSMINFGFNLFWYFPGDRCDTYGEYGPFGVCVAYGAPKCTCMTGFKPKDQEAWEFRDGTGGCERTSDLDCMSDGFLPMKNMRLPDGSQAFIYEKMNLSTCGEICRKNCSCAAYSNTNISGGGSGCAIWEVDRMDMRQYDDSEGGGLDFFVKVAASSDIDPQQKVEGLLLTNRIIMADNKEYINGLLEANQWGMRDYLRSFFVMLLMTDSMSRPEFVWEKTWHVMAQDMENVKRIKQNKPGCNSLIYDEASYKPDELKRQHQTMYGSLTSEQKGIYSTVMDVVDRNTKGMFFVYGYGGTRKTYLYKTMSATLRSQGHIVLNVASSGITALLREGERTTHSRFAIPINIVEDSMCHIPADTLPLETIVDFEADPRVPLILGRFFLRTGRALIDVYGEEITLRVNDEAVTFNLNPTTRYSSTYNDLSVNRIDIIDVAREEYEDINLVLNWEKCHFMVKEGIVLGHKISKNRLEVDREKVDVIAKLPHPTTMKGVRSFLGHAGFYRRFIQDFSKISRHMNHLLKKETLFVFTKDCIDAFETLKKKLTEAPIIVVPDWNLPFELMCDASDFAIGAVLGQ